MRVIEAVRKSPVAVDTSATLRDAARAMDEHVVGALVVTDDDRPVGILTDRDLVIRAVARDVPGDARVDAVMTTELVTLDADADLREAFRIFDSHPLRRIPVIKDGRLAGVITADDLVIDVVGDLARLARPITGQVIFGYSEPPTSVVGE